MFGKLYRPLFPLLAVGIWAALWASSVPSRAAGQASLSEGLARALGAMGWSAEARDVHWVDPPRGGLTALWRGPRALVHARLTPEGRLLAISGVHDISDTASVDESALQVRGELALWTVRVDDETLAIHSARLANADEPPHNEFGWIARLQMRLTWQQETGQLSGIQKQEYRIEPPTKHLNA